MFNKHIALLICGCALLFTQQLTANIVWSALVISSAILEIWFLIFISIIIEAIAFYICLKDISYIKAFIMSLTSNTTSFLLGWHTGFNAIIALIGSLLFYPLVLLFNYLKIELPMSFLIPLDVSINWIFMYFTSVLIELLAIKLIFKYPAKRLWIPILIGNLITYALIPIFYYYVLKNPLPRF